jgi:aspartyl-tRNA(Asn)/glutamyl-tRNA(Gln) amidotransferase subunit C
MPPTPPAIDVRKVASLARLALTDDEVALFSTQLASILEYANRIQDVDTAGIPPTSHPVSEAPHWRDDVPAASLDRTTVLSNAPEASVKQGLFKVPKVL